MDIILEYLPHLVFSFAATAAFALVFNCPRWDLPLCGLCGTISWMIYLCGTRLMGDKYAITAVLAACFVSSLFGRYLSYTRKKPLTIYLIGSIIPLVPGTGIYYTMYALMNEDAGFALIKGIEALKTAGAIAIGIMVVLSLPPGLFEFLAKKPLSRRVFSRGE